MKKNRSIRVKPTSPNESKYVVTVNKAGRYAVVTPAAGAAVRNIVPLGSLNLPLLDSGSLVQH